MSRARIQNNKNDFTIIIKDKKYVCKKQAVTSSEIIVDYIKKNPNSNQYIFEYDGPIDKFYIICDFFNFFQIQITKKDIDSIRPIAESLKITTILTKIDNFTDTLDEIVKQTSPVEEVFNMLYKIESITVDSIKKTIIKSTWCQSEENVKEFASFILQVIRSGYKLQPYLIDLIISLDQSSNSKNKLNILKPFIIKQVMNYFFFDKFYCGFTYKLVQKGVISIEKVMERLKVLIEGKKIDINSLKIDVPLKGSFGEATFQFEAQKIFSNKQYFCVIVWFLPELIEHKILDISSLEKDSDFYKFANYYYRKEKLPIYKKARETMEPDNEIINAIFNDDIDTLQKIVSNRNININAFNVNPFNTLETFQVITSNKLIDYSAAYGSIKCFKYLLLNESDVDQQTIGYAIFGGNAEIIRTLDQQSEEFNLSYIYNKVDNAPAAHAFGFAKKVVIYDNKMVNYFDKKYLLNPLKLTIILHQYDLFDWIVDSKIESNQLTKDFLIELANLSVIAGNVHSLIFCIDNGLSLSNKDMIINTSKYGYYTILKQILMNSEIIPNNLSLENINSVTSCGNISIVKLICDKFDVMYRHVLGSAIEYDYGDITLFALDKYNEQNHAYFYMSCAIEFDSTESFKVIVNKYPFRKKNEDENNICLAFCLCSCSNRNYEISSKLIDFLFDYEQDYTNLFFISFFSGSEEICKYILDKKKGINYTAIFENYGKLFAVNSTLSMNLIDKFNPELKESLSRIIFDNSIKLKNKDAFRLFIENNLDNRQLLLGAVNLRDVELVKNVLEYKSSPSFINQVFREGKALTVATSNGDLEIVQILLSLPGIDPNLSDQKGFTPLIIAISQLNIDIIGVLIDFYGSKIQSQKWQIQRSISVIKNQYFNSDNSIDSQTEEKLVFVLSGLLQIDEKLSFNGCSFLYKAIKKGMKQVTSFLSTIETIDINEKCNKTGETALICAIKSNESQLALEMLDHPKIDVNISDYKTLTALTCASANKMIEVVQKIVNHPKFDPDSSNVNLAFFFSHDNEITNILCSIKSLDVNYQLNYLLSDKNENESKFTYEKWIEAYSGVGGHGVFNGGAGAGWHGGAFGGGAGAGGGWHGAGAGAGGGWYGGGAAAGGGWHGAGAGGGAAAGGAGGGWHGGFGGGAAGGGHGAFGGLGAAAAGGSCGRGGLGAFRGAGARGGRGGRGGQIANGGAAGIGDVRLAPGIIEWINVTPLPIETSLTYAVKLNDLQKVQLIIQHSSFDKTRSQITQAIFYSIENQKIFEALFALVNDANIVSHDNVPLFEFLFDKSKANLIEIIIKDSNLNLSQNDLLKYYKRVMMMNQESESTVKLLNCLIEYDQNHNNFIGISDLYQNALQSLITFKGLKKK